MQPSTMKLFGLNKLLLVLGISIMLALIVRGALADGALGAPRAASNRVHRLQRQSIATSELASGLSGTGTSFNSLYGGIGGAGISPYEQQSTYGTGTDGGGLYVGGRGYGTGAYGDYAGYGASGVGGYGGAGAGGYNSAGGSWRGFGRGAGGYGRARSPYGGVKY